MITYNDVKDMPIEYWIELMKTLFEEFLEDFKQDYWFEIDTNEIAERVLRKIQK